MTTYPGGKDGAGVWQRIISHIPPHDVLVELFGGAAAVTRHILAARRNLVVEIDADVLNAHRDRILRAKPHAEFFLESAFQFLDHILAHYSVDERWAIYVDPPYHPSTLKSRPRYAHTLTEADHAKLLALLRHLPCPVLISGYRCEPYDAALADWYRTDYTVGTRGGPAIESLWTNFGRPAWPHDGRFTGADYRDRETRKRRRRTWRKRLAQCDGAELSTLAEDLAAAIADNGGEVLLADLLDQIRHRRNRRAEQLGRHLEGIPRKSAITAGTADSSDEDLTAAFHGEGLGNPAD